MTTSAVPLLLRKPRACCPPTPRGGVTGEQRGRWAHGCVVDGAGTALSHAFALLAPAP